MNKEEQKAIESVKSMFGDITIEELIKDKDFKISIYSLGIIDILKVIAIVDKQQKEIEEKNCLIDVLQHKIEELLDNKKEINYIKPIDIPVHNYINEDKIKEKIKEQRQKYFDIHDGKHSINEICFESTKVEGAVEVLKELLKEK